MKKILSFVLCLSIALAVVIRKTNVSADEITVELDGKQIEFDVKPEIIDGRTMVPLRKIFEEIGANVKWNNDTQTVSARKNSKTITFTINSDNFQIDKGKTDDEGNPIIETAMLEVPAQIMSGRTLVPARVISESFGLNVDWDEGNKKVVITSDDEKDDSWKENIGSINLTEMTYEGEGIEIADNQIKITAGGDFTLTGILEDGNIIISAKEKVKLRLSGAKITSTTNPCIFVDDADKTYITITDGTENVLIAENSEDGAIYSKENLEIKGDGLLEIESGAGHGIKASDNLNIENGSITINASSDGIHINDTFKMTDGKVDITAIGDGIDSESIVNISAGTINIETNGTPIENGYIITEDVQENPRRGMWEDEVYVEFEKSTKGINAEWMMVISGGEINVNSASHTIHCQDEIEINGGKFKLSSKYDKGISAHGNLAINGADTVIDIIKSTEGIESKNVMTINDGTFSVISSDDAINATGGNSGMMMPGGNFAGNGNPGEFTLPEGFEKGQEFPDNGQTIQKGEIKAGNGIRPQRGVNDRFQNMKRPFEMPQNGDFTPPEGEMPGGFMGGGMGRNMKECLIINGGYFELCGNDDCIDANGNIVINGGVIKATNPTGSFLGNFGVIDPDGQLTVSENTQIILVSGGRNERNISFAQNTITVYCENQHTQNEMISVFDSNGKVVYEYLPKGSFKAVLIASPEIKIGEKYSVKIGSETFETEITQKNVILGTQTNGGMDFGRV